MNENRGKQGKRTKDGYLNLRIGTVILGAPRTRVFVAPAASVGHQRPTSTLRRRSSRRPRKATFGPSLRGTSSGSGYLGVASEEERRRRDDHARRTPVSRTSSESGYQGVATEERSEDARSPRRPRIDLAHRTPAPKRDEDGCHQVAVTQRVRHVSADDSEPMQIAGWSAARRRRRADRESARMMAPQTWVPCLRRRSAAKWSPASSAWVDEAGKGRLHTWLVPSSRAVQTAPTLLVDCCTEPSMYTCKSPVASSCSRAATSWWTA
ncbi:uncharacterized protein LOC144138937 [Haemaphysalis longicornis]